MTARSQKEAIYWATRQYHGGEKAEFPGEPKIIFIFIFPGLELILFLKRARSCKANINANNTITGNAWFAVTLAFPSVILASGDEEWSWLGVDCWGQSSDECLTGDGSENRAQMAAGVVSFQIYEGTRHLLCSLGWSSRRKVFHFTSSSYFNCIPFTKELEKSTRKFFQPLLIHTSNRSVNYLVFVSFFGKGGKMVNRCSRHAFVERITLIQGYPKATSLRFHYGLLWVVSSCSIKPSKKSVPHQVTLFDIPAIVQQYSNTDTDFFNLLNVDFNLIL